MTRIAIDPVTRIEGHLRIEVDVNNGKVSQAWSSSTMWRGIETILKHRDPREAWVFAQRLCGVCTSVHAAASVKAVEHALGIQIPTNARIMRNLIEGIQYVHDHVIHFYHLHALDWVDIVNALQADPAKTSSLAQSISDWPKSSPTYFAGMHERLQTFVQSGQLGPFSDGYWGHPAYQLSPEANLLAFAHYLEALDWQRDFIRAHAILGAKNPHLQTFLVGGMARPVDPDSPNALNADQIALLRTLFSRAQQFIHQVYLPDVLAIAPAYLEYSGWGEGLGNFLVYGDFPMNDAAPYGAGEQLFFPRGIILNRDLSKIHPVDEQKITEAVSHSWYSYPDDSQGLRPSVGFTEPNYTGPKPPYDFLNTDGKYSWLKAPRYDGKAMEVGPLARVLVAYASGNSLIKPAVDGILSKLGLETKALFSTLGRTAARCVETVILADQLDGWLTTLVDNISKGDLRIHDNTHWDPTTWPAEAAGWGWIEAPRGALGHWIQIRNGKIANYQAVVPTTWNGSPRDDKGNPSPYEVALVGTPVVDPTKPVEILRTIHSFDPCMACSVHMYDPQHQELNSIQIAERCELG